MVNVENKISTIVMCGGLATRMGGIAKYLQLVTDQSRVIDLALNSVIGVETKVTDRIILASGKHHSEVEVYKGFVEKKYPDIKFDVCYSEPSGQINAIMHIVSEFNIAGPLAVIYGDEVIPGLNLGNVLALHRRNDKLITRVVTKKSNIGSSVVFISPDMDLDSMHNGIEDQVCFATGTMVLSQIVIELAKLSSNPKELVGFILNNSLAGAYIAERSFNINTLSDLDFLKESLDLNS